MSRGLNVLLFCVCAALLLPGCSSAKPVAAPIGDSPNAPVLFHPVLTQCLVVPNAQQSYGRTADGLLTYTFHLQNNCEKGIWVRVRPSFYDESGTRVVDEPLAGPRRQISSGSIETFEVVSADTRGHTVRVQVLPEN